MKSRMQVDSKLTAADKVNLSVATKQTVKLSKFSLRKRIDVLKNEWWYWDDIMQAALINEISTEETESLADPSPLTKDQENDTEEILQLLSTDSNELVQATSTFLLNKNRHSNFNCRRILFVYPTGPPMITILNHI